GLSERLAWAEARAAGEHAGRRWVGWRIDSGEEREGGLLSDTGGIDLDALDDHGVVTLEDVGLGRARGSGMERGANVGPLAFVLRTKGVGRIDRFRTQSLRLPADLGGLPLYWLGTVTAGESFELLRGMAEHERDPRLRGALLEAIGRHDTEAVTPYLLGV